MRLFLMCLLPLSFFLFATPAWAVGSLTLRCGGQVIKAGDAQGKVRQFCGKPTYKTTGQKISSTTGVVDGVVNLQRTTVTTENWTYNFGSSDFVYTVTFIEGTVTSIKRDGRGY